MDLPNINEQELLDTILTGLNTEKSKAKKINAAHAASEMKRWIEAVKRGVDKDSEWEAEEDAEDE